MKKMLRMRGAWKCAYSVKTQKGKQWIQDSDVDHNFTTAQTITNLSIKLNFTSRKAGICRRELRPHHTQLTMNATLWRVERMSNTNMPQGTIRGLTQKLVIMPRVEKMLAEKNQIYFNWKLISFIFILLILKTH